MENLNVYYHIVPIDDGYTVVCQDKNTGELYLYKKSNKRNPEVLIFSSEQAADEWLKLSELPKGCYKVQWFGTADVIEELADVR